MVADELRVAERDPVVVRSVRVRAAGVDARLEIATPPEFAGPRADASPFVAPLVLLAMRLGEDLHVEGAVSPLLLHNQEDAQRTYAMWDPMLRPIRVTAAAALEPPSRPAAGTGAFFSRGVDSAFTAAAPRPPGQDLTHLVFSDRLEPVHDERVRAEEIRRAREMARRVGLPLVVVSSTLRALSDPLVRDWEDIVGPALASIAAALAGGLGTVVIPSTDAAMTAGAAGTGPMLDPLFSTEAVAVRHDSVARGRVAKAIWLAERRPDLLEHLKVCWRENRPDNCGRCGKCLITMASLVAAGALEEARDFPREIDLDAIEMPLFHGLHMRFEWTEVLRALGDVPEHAALRARIVAGLSASGIGLQEIPEPTPGPTPGFRRHQAHTLLALLRDGAPYPRPAGWPGSRYPEHAAAAADGHRARL